MECTKLEQFIWENRGWGRIKYILHQVDKHILVTFRGSREHLMSQLCGSLVNTCSCYPGGEHPQLVVQQYKVRVRAKVQGALLLLNLQALSRV